GQSAGPGVKGADVAAVCAVAPGATHDQFVFDQERRAIDIAAALLDILDLDIPDSLACLRIQSDNVIVHGSEEDHAVADCHAAIELAVRRDLASRHVVVVGPQPFTGLCIQGEDSALARGKVHYSIDHEGGCVEAAFYLSSLKCPHRNYVLHVVGANL